MSIASQPDERADAIEVYLGHQGGGTLSLALGPSRADDAGGRVSAALQRATSSLLRGGLTGWVRVGMLVRRMRGHADPLAGLGQRDTFLALCRLTQAGIEAQPLVGEVPGGLTAGAHVRLFSTPLGADEALTRIQRVLGPYTAAGTVTRSGRAVIAWLAVRHLIDTRSRDYSLQVVHFAVEGQAGGQVSLMLPRDPAEDVPHPGPSGAVPPAGGSGAGAGPVLLTRRSRRGRRAPAAAMDDPAGVAAADGPRGGAGGSPRPADDVGLQAYLDAYRDHLTRELLLEPVVSTGPAVEFAWTPEPTGDGGVAVAGTVPATVSGDVVLRMADHAVAQLGERPAHPAGIRLGGPEPDGELLIQRWAVGERAGYVLSVAARSGDRSRPTQVLIHFAAAAGRDEAEPGSPGAGPTTPGGGLAALPAPPHEPPRTGPDVDEARGLTVLPLWWHSADARCDGNDVILYEMPFRGRRLRVRANDYPAEPMYTLLVGDPGAEVAAVDLEHWPSSWVRPRSF